MPITTVLLDIDGTLLDTRDFIYSAFEHTRARTLPGAARPSTPTATTGPAGPGESRRSLGEALAHLPRQDGSDPVVGHEGGHGGIGDLGSRSGHGQIDDRRQLDVEAEPGEVGARRVGRHHHLDTIRAEIVGDQRGTVSVGTVSVGTASAPLPLSRRARCGAMVPATDARGTERPDMTHPNDDPGLAGKVAIVACMRPSVRVS